VSRRQIRILDLFLAPRAVLAMDENTKLLPEQEQALLESLRVKREYDARIRLQAEAQAVARKFGDMAIEKVPDEAESVAKKDKRNFGLQPDTAVATITLNAVFLHASRKEQAETTKGKAKGGYGKKNAPKVAAKIERLPPPSCAAVVAAFSEHKLTLQKASKFDDGELALLRGLEAFLTLEANEDLLEQAPTLLQTLKDEGIVGKASLVQYWDGVQSTRESESKVLRSLKEDLTKAKKEHQESLEKLAAAQAEEKDAATRLRKATAEAAQAWGNAQSEEEARWEKAVNTAKAKAQADIDQRTRVVEACHKRQVQCLSTKEAADQALREKAEQVLPLELMDMQAADWFSELTKES